MNKVKLLLDDLHVESFAVENDDAELGTVHGQQMNAASGLQTQCYTFCANCVSVNKTNCPGDDTCAQSCFVSCNLSECPDANTCYDVSCRDYSCYYPCSWDIRCVAEDEPITVDAG